MVKLIVPDVGATVIYGLDSFGKEPAHWRVSGWVRVAPEPTFTEDDWILKILHESYQEVTDKVDGKKKRMQFCLREEATHVALSGICGAIAPIELCLVTGRVQWPERQIEDSRNSAVARGEEHTMIG